MNKYTTLPKAVSGHFHVHWWAVAPDCFVELAVQGEIHKNTLAGAFADVCRLYVMADQRALRNAAPCLHIVEGLAVDSAVRRLQRDGGVAGWVRIRNTSRVFGHISLPVRRFDPDGSIVSMGMIHNASFSSVDETSVVAPAAWRARAIAHAAAKLPSRNRWEWVIRHGGWLIDPHHQHHVFHDPDPASPTPSLNPELIHV